RRIRTFISSRLDYCNSLYVGINQSSLSHLQLVQNAAARLLIGTVTEWVGTAVALRPIMPHTPSRSLRSTDLVLLVVPKSRLKLKGDHAFAGATPKLWNSLLSILRLRRHC
ncbi:hypothetical protein LDENG_00051840, partial [Lucifuga dentata]